MAMTETVVCPTSIPLLSFSSPKVAHGKEAQRSYSSNACGELRRLPRSDFQTMTEHDRRAEGDFSWYVQGSSDGQFYPEESLTALELHFSVKSNDTIFFSSLSPLLRVIF